MIPISRLFSRFAVAIAVACAASLQVCGYQGDGGYSYEMLFEHRARFNPGKNLNLSSLRCTNSVYSEKAELIPGVDCLPESTISLALADRDYSSSFSVRSELTGISPAVLSDTLSDEEFSYAGHVRYNIDGRPPLRYNKLNPITLAATGLIYNGIMVGLHYYQIKTFWQDRRSTFWVQEDIRYDDGVDKLGHFYGGYVMSYYSSELLQGAGVSYEQARIWGTLMGIVYQGYVEFEDGYGSNWGFSPTDMYFDIAGCLYHLLQSYSPLLQNISPKWIYTPGNWIGEEGRTKGTTFIDDYSASTFFYTFKLYNVLPESARRYWLPWLNPSVGYAVRALDSPEQDRKIIIALDYDLVELLPDFRQLVGGLTGDVLNWLKQSFNYFKLPSPAIEFGQHGVTRFNLLYPFKLSIGSLKF